jgi:hypothetical protein
MHPLLTPTQLLNELDEPQRTPSTSPPARFPPALVASGGDPIAVVAEPTLFTRFVCPLRNGV